MLFFPSSQEACWGPLMYAVSKHVFKMGSMRLSFLIIPLLGGDLAVIKSRGLEGRLARV